ncbi:hypothetical protein VCHA53O466_140099 [Vibrio chagasii]|nr:hypothetical protein VCHA53O466_140099 [Vibrio chagasii]
MSKILDTIETFLSKKADIEAASENAVQSNNVTRDPQGRLHAPHKGFVWIDGNTYGSGEYLPEDDSHTADLRSMRIKSNNNAHAALSKLLGESSVSRGKTWSENGQDVGYSYLKVPATLKAKLEPITPKQFVTLTEATEADINNDDMTTWKFNMRGVTYAFNQNLHSDIAFDMYCEKKGLWFGENIFFNDKHDGTFHNPKNKKAMFFSPLAGKMVKLVKSPDVFEL